MHDYLSVTLDWYSFGKAGDVHVHVLYNRNIYYVMGKNVCKLIFAFMAIHKTFLCKIQGAWHVTCVVALIATPTNGDNQQKLISCVKVSLSVFRKNALPFKINIFCYLR